MIQDPHSMYLEARRRQRELANEAQHARTVRALEGPGGLRLLAAATLRWVADRIDTAAAQRPVPQANP